MTIQQKKHAQILQHGENLNSIFNTNFDSITLCKKLIRLERKANFAATCLLNTNTLNLLELNRFTGYDVTQASEDEQVKFFNKILNSVFKILGENSKEVVFINYDARGYTLKLKSEFIQDKNICSDWGGFGILAPEFTGK
jgi:hypothetical protein